MTTKNEIAKQNDDKLAIKTESILSERKAKKERLRPLRILIVEPKGKYCRTVWCAIGIGFTHFLLGGTVMAMCLYSINKGDAHISLCTIAYHFFSAEAILSLNYANGWSSPLRLRHRRFAHVFLQMCALTCAITGTVLITVDKGVSDSVHGITGIITTALAGLTFLFGPCALFGGRYLQILHTSCGIPTFLMSSVCICFGVFSSAFKSWAGDSVATILVIFVVFYTSFIVITCFMKCVTRI